MLLEFKDLRDYITASFGIYACSPNLESKLKYLREKKGVQNVARAVKIDIYIARRTRYVANHPDSNM